MKTCLIWAWPVTAHYEQPVILIVSGKAFRSQVPTLFICYDLRDTRSMKNKGVGPKSSDPRGIIKERVPDAGIHADSSCGEESEKQRQQPVDPASNQIDIIPKISTYNVLPTSTSFKYALLHNTSLAVFHSVGRQSASHQSLPKIC